MRYIRYNVSLVDNGNYVHRFVYDVWFSLIDLWTGQLGGNKPEQLDLSSRTLSLLSEITV